MDLFTSLFTFISVIIDGISAVIGYVVYLVTGVFSLLVTFVNYLGNLVLVVTYLPSDIQPYVSLIVGIIVTGFIVSAVSWAIHLVRG